MPNPSPVNAVLVINSGSSSVKYALFTDSDQAVLTGLAERLNTAEAQLSWKSQGEKQVKTLPNAQVGDILPLLLAQVSKQISGLDNLLAIGHRVVHGGELFSEPTRITHDNLVQLKSISHLAPLHNPANIVAIEILLQQQPSIPQVAVFDTAFHQSMPEKAYRYALPNALYHQHGIRRYGFHGTSHQFVSQQAMKELQWPKQTGMIVAHLGNGCSATAVYQGQSLDTSMGLTPLEGLMMGTRSGNIDPSIPTFLQLQLGMNAEKVEHILNKESGLLGISELSNDMRSLLDARNKGNELAKLAIDMFCYRLAKEIAGLATALPHWDALVFTGGIGENSKPIREQTISNLAAFGLKLNPDANQEPEAHGHLIHQADSRVQIAVITTNEEWQIASQSLSLVQQ